jgi:hypothetical protein
MDRLLRLGGAGMGGGAAPSDAPVVDTAEQVYISSLALLKMLKHGRAGHYLISTVYYVISFHQCCGSVTFWYGSGSADPFL